MEPFFFATIPVSLPRPAIYRRLGYRREATRLAADRRREIEQYLVAAQEMIDLQGTARRLICRIEPPARVVVDEATVFESRNLARFLKEAGEVMLMGATGGAAIMEAIRSDMAGSEGNATRGVVLDAAASEIVDAALDWIMAYFRQLLRREGKTLLNSRFSAGYGDFSLENQHPIHQLLRMDRLGVAITPSCLMVPEKSVTAITGVITLQKNELPKN
jgi:hypothetical protein